MGRIGRSFQLVGQSYRVLMQDKELMLLPLISGTIIAVVAVSFVVGVGLDVERYNPKQFDAAAYLPLFALYVVTYGVGIFFQGAVIAGATERMRGGNPTLGSALAAPLKRLPAILMWAVVAATIGTILRAIHDRSAFIGKIVAGLLGAAWSLATFFVVPVIVLEDTPVTSAVPESVELFKKTWGEQVVAGINFGVAAIVAWVTLFAVVGLLAYAGVGIAAFAVGVIGGIGLMIFFSALQGVFVASLYQYARGGSAAAGFDRDVLAHAFVAKR